MLFGFCLTIKVKSVGLPNVLLIESWIRPKYLDSIVFLANDVGHPISTTALSPMSFTLAICVWENHVEKIAGETETFTISRVSCQVDFKSKFIVQSTEYLEVEMEQST